MPDYFIRDIQALNYSKALICKMNELSAPLFNHTKITNFSYLKFNQDGTILNLTTEEKWIEFRFEQKIKYKIMFNDYLSDAKYNIPYTYLWPKNISDTLLEALHQFNIWNGCNIYISNPLYVEVFSFASLRENENINNFYINNLDLLRAFIIYFKEQIDDIPGINIKKNLVSTELTLPIPNYCSKNSSSTIFDNIYCLKKLKRIHFNNNFYLTIKELECCAYLLRGNNIKTIAKIANISARTVETHINNIKLRTKCSTKTELLELLSNDRWIIDALLNNK